MSGWIKLATSFTRHPKALAAGPTARHLYYCSLMWSGEYSTDGALPAYVLGSLGVDAGIPDVEVGAVADKLVEVGLWERTASGWIVHDWSEWQTTAEERERARERHAENARKSAARRREKAAKEALTSPGVDSALAGQSPVSDRSLTEPEVEVEVEVEIQDQETSAPRRGAPFDADFDAWYAAYPRKRERARAMQAYAARRRAKVPPEDLLVAAQRYAEAGRSTGRPLDKTKHPAAFLNNGWDDWLPGGAAEIERRAQDSPTAAARARLAAREAQGGRR